MIMLTIGKAIQIRPNPHFAEWIIALIAYVEPFEDGYVVCDYWEGGTRQTFSFMQNGCQHDRQVIIQGFSEWKNAA